MSNSAEIRKNGHLGRRGSVNSPDQLTILAASGWDILGTTGTFATSEKGRLWGRPVSQGLQTSAQGARACHRDPRVTEMTVPLIIDVDARTRW